MSQVIEYDTPRSPTYEKINDIRKPTETFEDILNGKDIDDLPIDFIGTKYFSDLYALSSILGAGSFGVALKVLDKTTDEMLAMKVCLL